MRWRLVVALLATCLLLGACADIAPPPAAATRDAATRAYHDAIEMRGRLSVQYQRNDQEEALHGSFTWSQTAQHTSIALLSPLGQTLAVIDVTPDRATLTQSDHTPRSAADADTLAADTLGWPLPVAGLRDWLQGFATDAQGRRWSAPTGDTPITLVTQDGWQISYVSWQIDSTSPTPRPRRIDLTRTTQQAGQVAIRIVLDDWQPS